ncbi:MAG: hypothetical protein COB65_10235 [Thalassobium sp.]|uniref:hypothetical protein n=1 Tax=Octadecabacter sp. SW4 TaxID=2602067 RepID=UPI000C0F1141|nr:hypothetical protein [Octadecabacter sp. SW4]PHQ81352.1 MAG: hypothetical protein COB65_10235 [Thalassobium sp.]QEE35017.1 hypothetical protein FTO60_04390 [Octadecabacter sp. SW4]
MMDPDKTGVVARVGASPIRRAFAFGVLFVLGAMMILIAFVQPPSFALQMMLIIFGAVVLWVAERMRRATTTVIELTKDGLRDSTGVLDIPFDQMLRVERGVFAMKPSNGFVLITRDKGASGWAPGLWWRVGRRLGVGGVTAAGAGKFMAEQIALHLASMEKP